MCIWCVLHGKALGSMKELPSCDSTFCLPNSFLEDGGETLEKMIDWDTVGNLPDALSPAVPERIIPLKTTGDGNCLLHAVSRAIWGVELYFELLRVKLHDELKANLDWYKKSAKEFTEEDWERVIRNAAKSGAHLEFMHTLALSNVIQRPIILYASDSDMERYGQGESGVAATFVPSRIGSAACVHRPIILAWQTTHKNHYVPIVSITGRGPVDFPLLKVAFPDALPEGEDPASYIHLDADVIEPQVVKLLDEQKKELLKRREDEQKLLEGLQETLKQAFLQDQQIKKRPKKRGFLEDIDDDGWMNTSEKEEDNDTDEEEEEGGSDEEGDGMQTFIAPAGTLIPTPQGIVRVPEGKTYLVTAGRGGNKKHKKAVEKVRKKMIKGIEEEEAQIKRLLKMVAKERNKKKSLEAAKKKQHKGQQWDYVFPVITEQGGPMRKIAFNKGDDPFQVAQKFLFEEGLSQEHLQKIASFIIQNSAQDKDNDNQEMPDAKPEKKKKSSKPPAPKGTRIPLNDQPPILYKTGKFDGMWNKIVEFNGQFAAQESTKKLAMTPEEGILLKRTFDTLQAVTTYHTSSFVLDEFAVLQKLMTWPPEKLFPVLDLIRLMVLHPKAAEHLRIEHTKGKNFLIQLLKLMQTGSPSVVNTNTLIVLKFLCNMFYSEDLKTIATEYGQVILKVCASCISSDNKLIRLALANLVVNYATQIANKPVLTELKLLLIAVVHEMLSKENETEALFSILAALGTLLYDDWQAVEIADKHMEVTGLVEKHISSPEAKISECVTDILNLIQWGRGA